MVNTGTVNTSRSQSTELLADSSADEEKHNGHGDELDRKTERLVLHLCQCLKEAHQHADNRCHDDRRQRKQEREDQRLSRLRNDQFGVHGIDSGVGQHKAVNQPAPTINKDE
jgi:hypothetical protein